MFCHSFRHSALKSWDGWKGVVLRGTVIGEIDRKHDLLRVEGERSRVNGPSTQSVVKFSTPAAFGNVLEAFDSFKPHKFRICRESFGAKWNLSFESHLLGKNK